MLFRGRTAVIAVAALICGSLISAESQAQGRVKMWDGEMPIRQPWLRDHMPADALLYARIPHLMGFLAAPKGNVLDPALRSSANVENLRRLRKGLAENVFEHLPMFEDLRFRTLEKHLRSPIEFAAFASPAPSALISLNLDFESDQALYEMFEVFAMIDPNFALVAEMGPGGVGQLVASGMPAVFTFDASDGQLLLSVGPGANPENFAAMLAGMTTPVTTHPMTSMESAIDDSGQGLFFWFNVEQAMPMMQAFLPPEDMQEMLEAGLDEVRAAAIGWGSANEKGRMTMALDMMEGGNRELLPYVSNSLNARSVGAPDALFLLSIPTAEEFSRIEARALADAEAETREDWTEGKAEFNELTGITVEQLLSAVGPEILFIFDRAGDYAAVRVRDRKLWDGIVAQLAEKSATTVEQRRISGDTYYHWDLPGEMGWLDEESIEELGWAGQLLRNQRDHYYWTSDGDFLYVASVPQVLMDREAYGAKTDIGRWLSESQHIDGSSAVLSFVGTTRKLPKRLYSVYVQILQFIGDIAQADLDIWSMPTAKQLGLPDEGTLGFTIKLGKPIIAMELTFENNPLEALAAGGGAGSIAMVGILAAIAIPAYQDYTIRAQVSEGLNLAAQQKAAITEFYGVNGRFPNANEADAMSVYEAAGKYTYAVIVEADTGIIVVSYYEDTAPEGGEIFMVPDLQADGSVVWNCGATIADKHVPAACRGGNIPVYDGDDA